MTRQWTETVYHNSQLVATGKSILELLTFFCWTFFQIIKTEFTSLPQQIYSEIKVTAPSVLSLEVNNQFAAGGQSGGGGYARR